MSQSVAKKISFGAIIILITLVCIQSVWKTTPVTATDESHNMRILLENLKQKLAKGGDFTVVFQFGIPLVKDDTTLWSFPYPAENPDMQLSLGEIGDDYICFDELAGEGFVTRCTPFSNIATVSYAEH
jgi:hypothetical protein